MAQAGTAAFERGEIDTLQINVGRVCNQTCSHCHVDAGPDRRESMSRKTAEQMIGFLAQSQVRTLDITGGAPEMNPHFRWIVEQASGLGRQVIDRCNLTILLANGFTDLPEFLAKHQVHIIASLPCYLEANCDKQRGQGVFGKSIEAIQRLNQLGYAQEGSSLHLDLVYNPTGLGLPPAQESLQNDYRRELFNRFHIRFNQLLTITNMPISRFLDDLLQRGEYEIYMQRLLEAFNPNTLSNLMCRHLISVDWQGFLFDCDFNQMLDLPLEVNHQRMHISELASWQAKGHPIAVGNHCYGCTAGCGSSCGGSLLPAPQSL